MVYEGIKFYGPYLNRLGRKHLVYIKDGKHRSISYPKYLMEIHLDRYLEDWETIDHIDEDFTNDSLDNLRVLSRIDNIKRSSLRNSDVEFICPECSIKFTIKGTKINDTKHDRIKGKAGPFCGKSCAGRYSQRVRMNRANKLEPIDPATIIADKYKNSQFE